MLSIQNFKEDISYVIIKKVCDLIIVLDGLKRCSMCLFYALDLIIERRQTVF